MLLEKYSSQWVNQFEAIKSKLENALNGLEFSIEHLGSTSVSNLDSKPIIDIDIIYTLKNDFERIKQRLEKIGYDHNGNQGISERDVFKINGKLTNEILAG
jgi:GrpB-like predicted nucleotidyltransferase (UPF0157 family)